MIFGFNTDVAGSNGIYHVQTEDRGAKSPVVESIIYVGGRILERRRTEYSPSQSTRAEVEELVRRQHRELVEAIQKGQWTPSETARNNSGNSHGYSIELQNPAQLIDGNYLRFRLLVKERRENRPAANVSVEVRWLLGGGVAESRTLSSLIDGSAEVSFPVPLDRRYATVLVCARGSAGREHAKFHVRGSSS